MNSSTNMANLPINDHHQGPKQNRFSPYTDNGG